MSVSDPSWEPSELTPKEIGLVRDHLMEVIASHAFAGSKRTQDFLQLIVSHALAGDFDGLRDLGSYLCAGFEWRSGMAG
jgi:hypothetical protein